MWIIRAVSKWLCVKLFLFVVLVSLSNTKHYGSNKNNQDLKNNLKENSPQPSYCLTEVSQNTKVSWPEIFVETCTNSNPLCIGNNSEVVLRCCSANGTWEYLQDCTPQLPIVTDHCPDDFINTGKMCVTTIENMPFPPNCPFPDLLAFEEYIDEVSPDLFPIWMPVVRNTDYGAGTFHWIEKTPLYKSVFDFCTLHRCTFNIPSLDYNCVIYHNSSYIEAVPCNSTHNSVCAYRYIHERRKSFCSQKFENCFQSDYFTSSKCFCVQYDADNEQKVPKAEFVKKYHNILYQVKSTETCNIGLEKRNNTYLWINSNTPLNYTNWSKEAIFGEHFTKGMITSAGWILGNSSTESNCSVIQKEAIIEENTELTITFDRDNKNFTLTLTNPANWLQNENDSFPQVHCFTDASINKLSEKIKFDTMAVLEDRIEFNFSAYEHSGNYWCEAFVYPDLVLMKTEPYLYRNHREEYVLIVNSPLTPETSPSSESGLQILQELIESQRKNDVTFSTFVPRIYKIISINETDSSLVLNFHLSNTVDPEGNALVSYSRLQTFLNSHMLYFTFQQFLITDLCVGYRIIVSDDFTINWPMTDIGKSIDRTKDDFYCIGVNGTILHNRCGGSFIDGAEWQHFEEPCSYKTLTNTTVNLTNIMNLDNPEDYVVQVVELSSSSATLETIDIHLIARYLTTFDAKSKVNCIVLSIIDNLIHVSQNILTKAQTEHGATDSILKSVGQLLTKLDISTMDEYSGDYFKILTLTDVRDLKAVLLQEKNEEYYLKAYNDDYSSEVYVAAIIFSDQVIEYLNNLDVSDYKIGIATFTKSSLFVETTLQQTVVTPIMRITMPVSETDFKHSISYKSYSNGVKVCAFWSENQNNINGYWIPTDQIFTEENDNIGCNFSNDNRYLTLLDDYNITYQLEQLSESSLTTSDKLAKTSSIIKSVSTIIKSVDLEFISNIVSTTSKDAPIFSSSDLKNFVDIINTIMDIYEETLRESESSVRSILDSYKIIVMSYDVNIEIEKPNIYMSKIFTDMKCFTVTCSSTTCRKEYDESGELFIDIIQNVKPDSHIDNGFVVDMWLTSKLFSPHQDNTRIAVYTNVIGVHSRNIEKVTVTYKSKELNLDSKCGAWVPSDWIGYGTAVYNGDKLHCTYDENHDEGRFFALIGGFNLTFELERLVESTDRMENILDRINSLTRPPLDTVTSYDIALIAKILRKVQDVDATLLNMVLGTVNNLMEVEIDILLASQREYSATEYILDQLWIICEKYNNTLEINKKNIMLIIARLDQFNMTGIEIYKTDETIWNITILPTDLSMELTENFAVRLELSQALLDEILNKNETDVSPTLIVNFFVNNNLFGSGHTLSTNSYIIGFQLPHYNIFLPNKLKVYFSPFNNQTENSYCAVWNEMLWLEQGKLRTGSPSCFFYQQGYFTLTESDSSGTLNVSKELDSIQNVDQTFSQKLYRLDMLSLQYYDLFKSEHLLQLSEILLKCQNVDISDLDSTANIINNVLLIDRTVLHQSQTEYNAVNQILEGTNCIAGLAEMQYSYYSGRYFWFLVCQLSNSIGAVIYNDLIKCRTLLRETISQSTTTAKLNDDMRNNILANNPKAKFVVSVFHNNSFFAQSDDDTSIVLGFSVPGLEQIPDGGLNVYFGSADNSIANYANRCASWDYITNTKAVGQWLFTDTNHTDQQIECEYSEPQYYSLIKAVPEDTNLTKILLEILNNGEDYNVRLERAKCTITDYPTLFKPVHILYVAQILNGITGVFQKEDIECLVDIVNGLMEIPKEIYAQSQEDFEATDLILFNLDRIPSEFQSTSKDVNIDKETKNFVLLIVEEITAIIIENCDEVCEVQKITTNISLEEFQSNKEMDSGIYVDYDFRKQLKETSSKIMFTVFFKNSLFNEEAKHMQNIVGNILGVKLLPNDQDLKGSFWFFDNTNLNNTEVCSFWNYTVTHEKIHRGYWQKYDSAFGSRCCSHQPKAYLALLLSEETNITNTLENILSSTATINKKLNGVIEILSEQSEHLSPVDIFLISEIMSHALHHNKTTVKTMNTTSQVVSELYNVDRGILRRAQIEFNATDRILLNFDLIASQFNHSSAQQIIAHDGFIVNSFDLKEIELKGILLSGCTSKTCEVTTIDKNANLTEITTNQNLFAALLLTDSVVDQIKESKTCSKLIINIFFQDTLFNEEKHTNRSARMIFGVLLPGVEGPLKGNISVIYNANNTSPYDCKSCSYWNYQVYNDNSNTDPFKGYWHQDQDPKDQDKTVICEYDHVTHFALLLAGSAFTTEDEAHILQIFTNINCTLSLIGIFGIMLTAILFEKWRRNPGNQILVNFSISITIKICMLYISGLVGENEEDRLLCYITGAVLHYAVLSEFCWMLIIAILQFKRFVEVLGGPPKWILLKACVCGWIFPVFPVSFIILIDVDNYYDSSLGFCYPSGYGLYLGVWLPLFIIISINFVIFLFIIYNIFHRKTEFKEQLNYEVLFQWRLALLLFSMLGLTWFFGFISLIQGADIFSYLFVFTASLQGFVMFLFFIVFNKSTRSMYWIKLKVWLYNNGYKNQ